MKHMPRTGCHICMQIMKRTAFSSRSLLEYVYAEIAGRDLKFYTTALKSTSFSTGVGRGGGGRGAT
jgi:hypothetical protein